MKEQRAPESLEAYFASRIEPWMEVLLVGLSPEVVAESGSPARLLTLRLGAAAPSEPWDLVFIRHDAQRPALVERTLERAWSDLRRGGVLGLIGSADESNEEMEPRLASLEGAVVAASELGEDRVVLEARKEADGAHDLVGIRRAVQSSRARMDALDALLLDVNERVAGRPGDGGSIKEIVGSMGDRDRDGYLAAFRAIVRETEAPAFDADALRRQRDHNGRLLAELVTRFRHFRNQSLDFLASLEAEDWRRAGPGPDGDTRSIAEHLRRWLREEEVHFETLRRRVGRSPQ